jgi:hypothetical protein
MIVPQLMIGSDGHLRVVVFFQVKSTPWLYQPFVSMTYNPPLLLDALTNFIENFI